MIAFNNKPKGIQSTWQSEFLAMLPSIEARLRRDFGFLDAESATEAVREAVAHAVFAYVRMHDQGRAHVVTPSTLAYYSSRQVKCGRPAASRMNSKEPLSLYGQLRSKIEVEQPSTNWIDTMVEDKRASVVDLVAAKLDVAAWFKTLPQRMKRIAKDLAFGWSTSEVSEEARGYGQPNQSIEATASNSRGQRFRRRVRQYSLAK